MIRTANNHLSNTRVLHVRFEGRSCDVALSELDVGTMTTDSQVKRRLARYLSVPASKLKYYKVDRHETGNMTFRPEAVFG